MTDEDLKQIRGVIKEELEPIKKTLEVHSEKLEGLADQLADVSEDVTEIKEASKSHDKRISVVEDKLDTPSPIR